MLNAVDVHPFVNGGAYWVDGFGANIFTQGRNGVLKHFSLERRRTASAKNDHDDDEEEGNEDDESLDLKYLRTVNEEEDSGFCACALSVTEDEKDGLLAISKSDGRVSLRTALERTNLALPSANATPINTNDPIEVDFIPNASLKLGMCMVLTFASSTTNKGRVLVGYEDGSLVLWDSASIKDSIPSSSNDSSPMKESPPSKHSSPSKASLPPSKTSSSSIITVPLCRLKVFGDSTPVISLDYSSALGLGFAGSTSDKLYKFQIHSGQNSATSIDSHGASPDSASDSLSSPNTSSSPLSLLPCCGELGFEGISSIGLRVSPDFPKLLVVGGWDSGVRIFTLKLKPLALLYLHKKTIRSVDFDPVSGLMAVGSDDSHVSLWRLYCQKKENLERKKISD